MTVFFDSDFMQQLSAQARQSPRLRSHHCFHQSHDDKVQRICIAIEPGSYLRPHAHMEPDRWELLTVLRGGVDFLIFDAAGNVSQRHRLEAGGACTGVEIEAGTWHSLVALQPGTFLFEVKAGPFRADRIAEFAAWAPAEAEPEAAACLAWLAQAQVGERFGNG